MSASIVLIAEEGSLKGRKFVFDRVMLCRVGRANDCQLRFPSEAGTMTVSRYHCILDIEPPHIAICDCDSRNGTYVNNVKIGQRCRNAEPTAPVGRPTAEHSLRDGDLIRIGDTVLRVVIVQPAETETDLVNRELETLGC